MPKKKVEKKVTKDEVAPEVVGEVSELVVEEPKVEEPKAEPKRELPTFEGVKVLEVIGERGDLFHCKMANGTTMHVPKSLF